MSHYARSVGISRGHLEAARARELHQRSNSTLEAEFELGIRALKFPRWVRNYRAIPGRKFELDFAWPERRQAIEIDGAMHRISARFHADIEKHALLLFEGWRILRVGGRAIRDGIAFEWAERFILEAHDA